MSQHYSQNRIVQSLKTKSVKEAFYQSQNLLHKLNEHWFYLRVKDENTVLFTYQFTRQTHQKSPQNPKLSDALKTYFKLKGKGKGEIFFRATRRAVRDVIALLKDRYLNDYSTTDAAHFRDHLLDRRLVTSTVKRVFAIIRAVINLSIQEYGLSCKNAFARTYIPDLEDSIKRQPIPIDIIREIQKECMKIDDPNRWLIALISDTGMRLSEALGLKISDIKSNEEIEILTIEGGYYAVIKYSGRSSDKNFIKNKNILEKELKKDDIVILSPPIRASYNSPFTLPMLKRNEVMFRIDL